jgi:haloalkane dehalogenase
MPIIRTPDERFANLSGWPYEPHYIEINGLRIHYVEAGSGDPILCLHGEPTWSYLYRKMIPSLSQVGRVIAVDFVGFGRSDKLTEIGEYSYQMHHDVVAGCINQLELRNITLVCQDWGGLLGLPVATEMPERFARLVIMNTGLPTGDGPISEGFMQWRAFAERMGVELVAGQIIAISTLSRNLPEAVQAAYDAPFPDASYRAGVAAFPLLVPIKPDDPGAAEIRAARQALESWDKPVLVMFSDNDPVTRGGDKFFCRLIPTANQQPEIVIQNAGHFLQEEKGEEIAGHIVNFLIRS